MYLPSPDPRTSWFAWGSELVRTLQAFVSDIGATAFRQGQIPQVGSFTAANLPDETTPGRAIYVSDETTLAYSDGASWRRAVTDPGSNGIVVRTASGTTVARTIAGTAAEITVTDGSGVSANPTLSLPSALTFTGKTVTGGTFTGLTALGVIGNTTLGDAAGDSVTVNAGTVILNNIPTSSAGLTGTGAIWSNAGVLTLA